MTFPSEQFPYVPRDPALGHASLAPMLPRNPGWAPERLNIGTRG